MLSADNVFKTYRRNAESVQVLQGLSVDIDDGEFLAVVGASGSGKSTLMHLLGTLDAPDQGSISLDGKRIDTARGRERDRLRNETFGFIFQFYHLLPELDTLDNVLMPAYIAQSTFGWMKTRRDWKRRATALLHRVGLGHRLSHKPRELSGGEMQRAAVARALLRSPKVLLADEPTGNLDTESGATIVRLLKNLNREDDVTVVMVTHNLEIAAQADRVVRMVHGNIVVDRSLFPKPVLSAAG